MCIYARWLYDPMVVFVLCRILSVWLYVLKVYILACVCFCMPVPVPLKHFWRWSLCLINCCCCYYYFFLSGWYFEHGIWSVRGEANIKLLVFSSVVSWLQFHAPCLPTSGLIKHGLNLACWYPGLKIMVSVLRDISTQRWKDLNKTNACI